MKRDFDLIRQIMTDVEKLPPDGFQQTFKYPEYSIKGTPNPILKRWIG